MASQTKKLKFFVPARIGGQIFFSGNGIGVIKKIKKKEYPVEIIINRE